MGLVALIPGGHVKAENAKSDPHRQIRVELVFIVYTCKHPQ